LHVVVPVIAGIGVAVVLIAIFSLDYEQNLMLRQYGDPHDDYYVNVNIPLGTYDMKLAKEFQPQKTRIVLYEGENCCGTVRWVNNDIVPFRLHADENGDIAFLNATRNLYVDPGEYYEYVFTKPGEYRFYGETGQIGIVEVLFSHS
jgi:hypothetical protein